MSHVISHQVVIYLTGHVDGGGGHGDGRPPGHDVQVHRLLGDAGGGLLYLAAMGEGQRAAEPRHEVPGGDQVHRGVVRLQDQLEAAPDLLLAHGGHGHDLLEGPGHALLSARDVEAGSGDGVVGATLQVLTIALYGGAWETSPYIDCS